MSRSNKPTQGGRYAMMIYYPRNNFGDHKNEIERIEKSGMKGNTLEAIATQFMRYHRRSRRGDGGFLVDVQMPKFDVKADLTMARTMTEVCQYDYCATFFMNP